MSNSIEVSNLKYSYNDDSPRIIDIDTFSLESNKSLFLYGPSGSGKSTLLSLLCGIYSPQEGSILYNQSNITTMSALQRDRFRGENIGYIFQQFNLIDYLSVKENILLPMLSQRTILQPDEELLEITSKLKIDDLINKNIKELSVGQCQRVAVARAIIGSPSYIIADEPTSALDEENKNEFIKLLLSTKSNNTTVLFVSHDKTLSNHFDKIISLPEINKV